MLPSTITTTRNAWIKLVLGIVFAGLGAWIVSLVIDMVGSFGAGMGVDEHSRQVYARAHVAVHIFGTACSVAIYLFIVSRARWFAGFAAVAILACGVYGIGNMIGFTTTNRLSVAGAKTASTAADERQYQQLRQNKQDAIVWTRSTIVTAESPRERRRLETALAKLQAELDAIKPPKPTAETVFADPQATWFSRITSSSSETWALALPVPVAFLLFLGEVLSFVFSVHLLIGAFEGWRQAKAATGNGDDKDENPSNKAGNGGNGSTGNGDREAENATVAAKESVPPSRVNVVTLDVPSKRKPFTRARAIADLSQLLEEHGSIPCQQILADRWGVCKATVCKWLKRWEMVELPRLGIVRHRAGNGRPNTISYGDFAGSVHAAGNA